MSNYPKDFPDVLAGVWDDIKSGHFKGDSKDALGEAWHRWRKKHHKPELSTQQRRYAYRKSFENPRRRHEDITKVPDSWEIVFYDYKGHPYLWTFEKYGGKTIDQVRNDAEKFYGVKLKPEYARGKNPGEKWHLDQATKAHLKAKRAPDKEERDHDIGRFEAHLESARASRHGVNPSTTPRQRRFFGAELGRRRAGKRTITGLPTKELRKMARKNPIAVYNPPSSSMRLLYARAFIPKVFGTKTTGEHKGEKFVHDFKTEVKIYGLPKGGLMIQSLDGSRLWADERDLDKFERR